MQLTSGQRLGPYEVVAPLGAGGMGEVYRGRDTRLGRTVAIKILPSLRSANPESRERFQREARSISLLNHPHVCTLYDVGQDNSVDYLIMEYIEGETLAEALVRPLPFRTAIRYAIDIADALNAAHRSGIVHRDLKPGNVLLTKSGPKLVDFGLSRYADPMYQTEGSPETQTVPRANPMTAEGAVIGTAQYMSPEQVEGKHVDPRSDIFSFGVVLYEMLTGKRAFDAGSTAGIMGAILDRQPAAVSALQPLAPPTIDRLVKICLEKSPDDRWQTAHDLLLELKWIEATSSERSDEVAGSRGRRRSNLLWAGALLAALVGAAAVVPRAFQRDAPKQMPIHFTIPLPPGQLLMGAHTLAISADGTRLAYSAVPSSGGTSQLFLRRLDRLEHETVAGTEGALNPFFSPDGKSVGFFTFTQLKKYSIETGAITVLADVQSGRGATWSSSGTIYFAPSNQGGIWKVRDTGGQAEAVTVPDAASGENSHRWPQLLPGEEELLMTVRTDRLLSFDDATIAVLSLRTGRWRTLFKGAGYARYLQPGKLLFSRSGSLFSVALDARTMQTKGSPISILQGVLTSPNFGAGWFAVTHGGMLAYVPGTGGPWSRRLIWANRRGEARPVTAEERFYDTPRLSPAGDRIAASIGAANDNIWSYDITRGTLTRVSFEPGDSFRPVWTRNGKGIIYSVAAAGGRRVIMRNADGTGEARELIGVARGATSPSSHSPTQDLLAYDYFDQATGSWDIYLVSTTANPGAPRRFIATPADEGRAEFSPDGNWLAYSSSETGRLEIYLQQISGGERWQVSTEGGVSPRWRRDGRELFYHFNDRMYAVELTTGVGATIGKSRLLFEKPYFRCNGFDVTAAGDDFLLCADGATARRPAEINVVTRLFGPE